MAKLINKVNPDHPIRNPVSPLGSSSRLRVINLLSDRSLNSKNKKALKFQLKNFKSVNFRKKLLDY